MDKVLILNEIKFHYQLSSDSDFARFLGISAQTLHNWKKRNTFDIETVYTRCLDISADWLITGRGSMLKDTVNKTIETEREETTKIVENWRDKYYELKDEYTDLLKENNLLLKKNLRDVLSI